MKTIESKAQIGEILNRFVFGECKIGLVSTMGNLHEGHLSLIRKAREMSDVVVVLVFVNPLLVGDASLLAVFDEARRHDRELLEKEDVDYVFFASREDFFRAGHRTFVRPSKLIQRFHEIESEKHLTGLATAYFQILNLFKPTFILMGQKNYIDFYLLKRLIKDYHFSTEAVLCPTVREEGGLPYSSFSPLFSPEDRQAAIRVTDTLQQARQMLMDGESSAAKITAMMEKSLKEEPRLESPYIGILEPATMESIGKVQQEALIMISARLGRFRIIDNIIFRRNSD